MVQVADVDDRSYWHDIKILQDPNLQRQIYKNKETEILLTQPLILSVIGSDSKSVVS